MPSRSFGAHRARRIARLAALAVLATIVSLAAPARAQCTSSGSSCVTCHETRAALPVLGEERPWHRDHAFGDLCSACHGGDPEASSAPQAHRGLRSPLEDVTTSCAGCHAADALERAARYRASVAAAPSGDIGDGAPRARAAQRPEGPAADERRGADRVLAAIAVLLGGVLLAVIAHRRGALALLHPVRSLREETWPPEVAGAGLGLAVAISEVVLGRPLAASGGFDRIAAFVGRWLFPTSPYYRFVLRPAITWQVWLLLGLAIGAFTSARLAGVARWRWLPEEGWSPHFGTLRRTRLVVAFVGAMLVQIGAGIAGGCTSGLAISGGAVLAPAAFLFVAGMFAGGIPTARWMARRRSKDGERRP